MLDHLGHGEAASRVLGALEETLAGGVRTPDLGGDAGTEEVTRAVVRRLLF